jgi:hypothetical protein
MSRSQAVRSGFSVVFRRPALFAAELAWRWTFGTAALLLTAYSILLFLASTPVSDRDLFGLSGIIPGTARAALAHIFSGSGPMIVRLLAALTIGLGLLWWLASAFGRAAVLQVLGEQRERSATATLVVLLQLNLLRMIISILAILAIIGCIVLASHAAITQAGADQIRDARADLSASYFVLILLAFAVGWLWSTLNWYLSVAPLIALQTGRGMLDSLIKTSGLVLRRFRQFFWVGLVFGVLRLLFAGVFLSFALSVFAVLAQFAAGLATTGVFLCLLVYFAGADFLAIARLAAYARILEWDSESPRVNATDQGAPVVGLDHPAAEPI